MERIVGLGRELDLGYGSDLDETHWLIALAEQWSFTVLAEVPKPYQQTPRAFKLSTKESS